MSETTQTLIAAWDQRLTRATQQLAQAEAAPALVTPEHLAQLRADVDDARRHVLFWTGQ